MTRSDRLVLTVVVVIATLSIATWINMPSARGETLSLQGDGSVACPGGGTDDLVWLGGDRFAACGDDYDFLEGSVSGDIVVPPSPPPGEPLVAIPAAADWTDRGIALQPGAIGASDHWFAGLSPCGLIRRSDGTYVLYYAGAVGPRADGEPKYRQLHAATSSDGIAWTKAGKILEYIDEPASGATGETGIFACAPLEYDGRVYVYAETMPEFTPGSVHADIQVADCGPTGVSCGPLSLVAWHEGGWWGDYDEFGVLGAFVMPAASPYGPICLYTLAQVSPKWALGLACNDTPTGTFNGIGGSVISAAYSAKSGGQPIPMGGDDTEHVVFLAPAVSGGGIIDVRTGLRLEPWNLSAPVVTYDWSTGACEDGAGSFIVMLDRPASRWLMVRHNRCWPQPAMHVFTAPVVYQ